MRRMDSKRTIVVIPARDNGVFAFGSGSGGEDRKRLWIKQTFRR